MLANSTTAREAAKLTEDQTRAADKLAASIKFGPEIEAPSPLTSEAVKFLGPEQRRWLATLIIWTEGPLGLRHPVVCAEVGIDEPARKRIYDRIRRDEQAVGKSWAKLLEITRFKTPQEEVNAAVDRLFELTLFFEKDVWTKELSAKDQRALLALPAYDKKAMQAVHKDVRFTRMMALGETADREKIK